MSQRKRLSTYINRPTVSLEQAKWGKALEHGIEVGVNVIFDGIGKGIKAIAKAMKGAEKSPDPHKLVDDKGQKIYSTQWVGKAVQGITKYWTDPKWVGDNLHPRTIQAPVLAMQLSVNGKVAHTPLEALRQQEKIVRSIIQQHQSAMNAYCLKLRNLEKQAETMISKQSPEATAAWMISEAKKLKQPLAAGFTSPMLVGGVQYTVSKTGIHNRIGRPDNYRVDSTKLEAVSSDGIIQAAKLMVEQLATIGKLWEDAPIGGSGCDYGVWTHLEYDSDYGEELWELYYYQAIPEVQSALIHFSLSEWTDTLYAVSKWMHSQLTDKQVTLEEFESARPATDSAECCIGLFGTCADSDWRGKLIPLLNYPYFNPVVDDWDEQAREKENQVKDTAAAVVFTITPRQTGFYSFVELTDLAIRDPKRLYPCFLNDDAGASWSEAQQASIDAIKEYLTNVCGVVVYTDLESLSVALNTCCGADGQ